MSSPTSACPRKPYFSWLLDLLLNESRQFIPESREMMVSGGTPGGLRDLGKPQKAPQRAGRSRDAAQNTKGGFSLTAGEDGYMDCHRGMCNI